MSVYRGKCEAERKRFIIVMRQDDQKCNVFMIPKRKVKTNLNIIGKHGIKIMMVYRKSLINLEHSSGNLS